MLTLLIAIHFWRIRKDGGLSRPGSPTPEQPVAQVPAAVAITVQRPANARQAASVYGLQGFVRGPVHQDRQRADDSVFSWPNLLIAELFVFLLTRRRSSWSSRCSSTRRWSSRSTSCTRPIRPRRPWYFLGLQEMVSYSAFWGGVGIPGLDGRRCCCRALSRSRQPGVGRWFARERLLANTIFLTLVILNVILIVIGTFFRGPNWEFVSPF